MEPPHDPLQDHVIGYPKLAARMGMRPETAIFRKFSTLNARNLLYMQAELAGLECRLDQVTKQDSLSEKGDKRSYAKDFEYLHSSHRDGDREQLNLVLLIRTRLKEYSTTFSQLCLLNILVVLQADSLS